MKKKLIIALCILVLLCSGYVLLQYWCVPDGKTTESREEIFNSDLKGTEWQIAVEKEFQGYMLCGIYAPDGKSGIAVFEPNSKGYKLVSREWRDSSDEIIISGFIIDRVWYDIIWFHGASTESAELTYTIEGNSETVISFETADMEIICNPAPSDDYRLDVIYYDKDGNKYE